MFEISSRDFCSASIPKKKPTIPPKNIRKAAIKKHLKIINIS